MEKWSAKHNIDRLRSIKKARRDNRINGREGKYLLNEQKEQLNLNSVLYGSCTGQNKTFHFLFCYHYHDHLNFSFITQLSACLCQIRFGHKDLSI